MIVTVGDEVFIVLSLCLDSDVMVLYTGTGQVWHR